MSTTTLSVDKDIRDRASQRARNDKLSVSAVVRILLNDYAEGRIEIGTRTTTENGFTETEEAEILKAAQETKDEKNVSDTFDNTKDALNYLHSKSS